MAESYHIAMGSYPCPFAANTLEPSGYNILFYVTYIYLAQRNFPSHRLSDTGSEIHCHQSKHSVKTQHLHESTVQLITAALVGGRYHRLDFHAGLKMKQSADGFEALSI